MTVKSRENRTGKRVSRFRSRTLPKFRAKNRRPKGYGNHRQSWNGESNPVPFRHRRRALLLLLLHPQSDVEITILPLSFVFWSLASPCWYCGAESARSCGPPRGCISSPVTRTKRRNCRRVSTTTGRRMSSRFVV